MTALGFQLYSLHEIPDSLPQLIDAVAETPFEGVEFAGFGETTPGEATAALDAAGLAAAGAHVGLDAIESDSVGVAETYRALGTRDIVVPWLDPAHFETRSAVEAAGERLTVAASTLAEHDITLHYHNHDQEFVRLDGAPALDHLLAAADGVRLELDLGWAGAAGYDPLTVFEERADQIDLVHLKDYDASTGDVVEVGAGDLDIGAAVSLARDHDIEWVIYEAEERPDSYDTLDHAATIADTFW